MKKNSHKITLFQHAPNTRVYPADTILFNEGDEGNAMYAIKRGAVSVVLDGRVVETIGQDEVFGEMALLGHRVRAATVVTTAETELVEIDEEQFFILVRHHPHFALMMMRMLADRVRNMRQHALNRVTDDKK